MFDSINNLLHNNQFASGGLLVVAVGAILTYLRSLPIHIKNFFLRNFTNEITFLNNDPCFEWVERWFSVNYKPNFGRYMVMSEDIEEASRTRKKKYYLAPNYGWYFQFYKGRLVIITKINERATDKGDKIRDKINIRLFGAKKYLENFLEDINKAFYVSKKDGIFIKTISMYGDWETRTYRDYANKPILPDNQYEKLKADLKGFYSSYEDYKKKGLLYKRGYMFYGEPGTGKTTAIISLAFELKKDIYILSNISNISPSAFIGAISYISDNGILVIEDIDCFDETHNRDNESKKDKSPTLNLSTILNTLDGACTPTGLVFIITTNKKDKLDDALIRPGRIDVAMKFGKANKEQLIELYTKLKSTKDGFEEFYVHHPDIGMAEAQKLILEK